MRPELPRPRRTYTVEDARQARKDLRVRLLAIEQRMTALERARHAKARGDLKGGLSFPRPSAASWAFARRSRRPR